MTTLKPAFTDNALTVLNKRYLLKDADANIIETPEGMLRRVSFDNDQYYEMMARLDFLPNSPTLFNIGTGKGTGSACFKFDVADSLVGPNSINDTHDKAALVQKWGGGVGYVFSALRPRGAPVGSTHGYACGPIEVMKHYHSLATMITQGGKRDGAQMGILHCEHADLQEFIHCKDVNPDALSTFNISVAATDAWMMQAKAKGRKPDNPLWEMAQSAWRTGDPGCYFIDTSNRTNPTPWLGSLSGTNPCGEVPLLNNEPCNLGSINLGNFYRPDLVCRIDWYALEPIVRLATRYLDDVLDHNWFPHQDITDAALLTRKLGLGVMGFADLLALLNIHYDSEEAVDLSAEISHRINRWALEESWNLARDKSICPAFDYVRVGVQAEDVSAVAPIGPDGLPPRNATRTCIAPTGTISLLAGASSGIEPHFARTWTRYMGDGTPLEETIPVLQRCAPFVPHTAMEIDWGWHIRHQAAWQRNVDLAVSKTINMPESATPEEIYDAYMMMWETGCKGGTIYRDNCRATQVLNTTPRTEAGMPARDASASPSADPTPPAHSNGQAPEFTAGTNGSVLPTNQPYRRRLPDEREAVIHKFTVGEQEGYLSVGLFPDGSPGELFATVSKEGSTVRGLMDTIGILTSMALQYGIPLDVLTTKLQAVTFEPQGMTHNKLIPTATSIVDYIFHWLRHRFMPHTLGVPPSQPLLLDEHSFINGLLCPDCGARLIAAEGCMRCSSPDCGYEKCG